MNVLFALGLTLLAGLSTGIGSLISLYTKKTNYTFLSGVLGFSAGVMLYVSTIEIFPKARTALESSFGEIGYLYTTLTFFAGILLIAFIDYIIPQKDNPHEIQNIKEIPIKSIEDEASASLLRMGMFSAFAIAIHNFPEGFATFFAALFDPNLGISIAIALAIHNIPEGIAVAVPIYFATGNRKKAFWYSFASGFSEPLGALVGFVFLMPFFSEALFGFVFAFVAGIMVYISLDELLPTAEKYGQHHIAIIGVVLGMAVMATSLLLF